MAIRNSIKLLYRPDFQCITMDILTWQLELKESDTPTTLTEISWPQVSGGFPYKVVISQWVPTRPEVNKVNEHYSNITLMQTQRMVLYPISVLTQHPHRHNVSVLTQTHIHTQANNVNDALWKYIGNS